MPVKQGVPRGSIVGPILFVFFIHCMSQIRMTIFMPMTPHLRLVQGGMLTYHSSVEKNINEDLDQAVKWSKMNKISQTRTKCMFVVGK